MGCDFESFAWVNQLLQNLCYFYPNCPLLHYGKFLLNLLPLRDPPLFHHLQTCTEEDTSG